MTALSNAAERKQRHKEEKALRKAIKAQRRKDREAQRIRRRVELMTRRQRLGDRMKDMPAFLQDMMDEARFQIDHNLRLQLIVAFALCFMAAGIVFNYGLNQFARLDQRKYFDYSKSMEQIASRADTLAADLERDMLQLSEADLKTALDQRIREDSPTAGYDLLDEKGNVLISSSATHPGRYEMYNLVRDSQKKVATDEDPGAYTLLIPIQGDVREWLIYRDKPQGELKHRKAGNMALFIASLEAVAAFILMFFILTKRKVESIQQMSYDVRIIARGNLNHRVQEIGRDELYQLASAINHMSRSLKSQIESERAAEKSKQDLITNVSHDLRTPLTSILGYLRLVLDKRYESPEQMEEYLQTVYNKSEALKSLIDDLFEYTKLSNAPVQNERTPIAVNELVEQMLEEFYPACEDCGLELVREIPEDDIIAEVDPVKLHRVFENLLSNAFKYSDRPGTIVVSLRPGTDGFYFTMENPAAGLENADLSRLFERFFRLESSRSSETGGTGLGLAIAKGIVDAHHGRIEALWQNGCIRFEVWIPYHQ